MRDNARPTNRPRRIATPVQTVAAVLLAASAIMTVGATAMASNSTTLKKELLKASQVPRSWKSVATTSSGGVGCLHSLLEPPGSQQGATASAAYQGASGAPAVSEKLVSYSTSSSAAYNKVTTAMKSCTSVSGVEAGHKVSGSIAPMKIAKYGDASSAYVVRLKIAEVTVGEDVIVVRKGGTIMGFALVNIGAPPLAQFKQLLTVAMRDLTQ